MRKIVISYRELSALLGLPFLQRLLYLQGLRPYVDYQTGVVGVKRGISYQSIAEILFVEPHSGIQGGSPSKDQLRRALRNLEKAGLIEIQSYEKKLILKCLLLDLHQFAQNKLAINPPYQSTSELNRNNLYDSSGYNNFYDKPTLANEKEPAIPHISNNNYIFYLGEQFKKFWTLYPVKCGKQQAWEVFQVLLPTEDLLNTLLQSLQQQCQSYSQQKAQGLWVPNWCNPANWLSQRRWEDEVNINHNKEILYETHQSTLPTTVKDLFWQPIESARENEPTPNNIVDFEQYREQG